jgi:hypothetical protein
VKFVENILASIIMVTGSVFIAGAYGQKGSKKMIWKVRCKKCREPIENDNKSIEIYLEGKEAIALLRSYCNFCNVSSVFKFRGSLIREQQDLRTHNRFKKKRRK